MATSLQLQNKQLIEQKRANRASEDQKRDELAENRRSNKSKEGIERQKVRTNLITGILNPVSRVMNDPKWYALNRDAVDAVANLSYSTPIGRPDEGLTPYARVDANTPIGAPGIMALPFVPTIGSGTTSEKTNPVMLAANKIYVWVRHANSGSRNYEAVDYMQFLLSADSIMTLAAWFVKCYKCVCTYDNQNVYLGKGLLRSMGFSEEGIEDSIKSLSSSRARYNVLVQSINSLNIPDVFYYNTRHVWLASTAWYDRKGPRAQIYNFYPRGYHQYQYGEGTAGNLGQLTYSTFQLGAVTLEYILDILSDIVNKFIVMEDVGLMGGDSLKAFGPEAMVKLSTLPMEPLYMDVEYSEEVLSQIQCATLLPPVLPRTANIYQKDGVLRQGYSDVNYSEVTEIEFNQIAGSGITASSGFGNLDFKSRFNADGVLLNVLQDKPTPDDNMVATRLVAEKVVEFSGPAYIKTGVGTHGSEVIVEPALCHTISVGNTFIYRNFTFWDQVIWKLSSGTPVDNNTFVSAMQLGIFPLLYSSFRHAPICRAYSVGPDHTAIPDGYGTWSFIQIDNYVTVSYDNIGNMHYVALNSLFDVDNAKPKKA